MSIRGKKVLVLGLSKSGIAAAKFAKKHGAIVYLSEGKYVDEENMSVENMIIDTIEGDVSKHIALGVKLAERVKKQDKAGE